MTSPDGVVQPQPTPITWKIGEAQVAGGQKLIVFTYWTVIGGPFMFLMSPDEAVHFGSAAADAGTRAKLNGLFIPPGSGIGNFKPPSAS